MRRRRVPPTPGIHRVTIAGELFVLASAQDAERLKQACVLAARRGGGLVGITSATGDQVEVLVSPGLQVFFDTVQLRTPVDGEDEIAQPGFDWDYTAAP